jgi:hypothetical protein
MEDSTWEGWTTMPPPPEGFALGYPEGRKVAGGPPGGWMGQLRTMPRATDDAIKFAARTWTHARAEEFERVGRRRYIDRATGVEYDLVHGNPLLGDEPELADVFLVADDALLFLRRVDRPEAEPRDGHDGADAGAVVMRPQRGTLGASIQTFGPDFGLYPSDCWGLRDWRQTAARYQSVGKSLTPAATITLPAGFRLFPGQRAPETKGERAVREIRAKIGTGR